MTSAFLISRIWSQHHGILKTLEQSFFTRITHTNSGSRLAKKANNNSGSPHAIISCAYTAFPDIFLATLRRPRRGKNEIKRHIASMSTLFSVRIMCVSVTFFAYNSSFAWLWKIRARVKVHTFKDVRHFLDDSVFSQNVNNGAWELGGIMWKGQAHSRIILDSLCTRNLLTRQ